MKICQLNERLTAKPEYQVTFLGKQITIRREELELENTLADMLSRFQIRLARYKDDSAVVSGETGYVTEILSCPGEFVNRNYPLITMRDASRPDEDNWILYSYFNVVDGRKIRPDMRAIVTPSVVKAEKEGSIVGTVLHVSPVVVSTEALNVKYHNIAMVNNIFKQTNSMPIEVQILLHFDKHTPSNFEWTSTPGPDIRLQEGTFCVSNITVKKIPPIELIFSKVKKIATGRGVKEKILEETIKKTPLPGVA